MKSLPNNSSLDGFFFLGLVVCSIVSNVELIGGMHQSESRRRFHCHRLIPETAEVFDCLNTFNPNSHRIQRD